MRQVRVVMLAGMAVALGATTGCGFLFSTDAGYVMPAGDREGHDGVHAVVRAGMHSLNRKLDERQFGGQVGLRVKVADQLKQLSISESAVFYPLGFRVVAPYVRAGIHAFQFEIVDDEFGFGMFSPVGEAGVMIRISNDPKKGVGFLELGASAEYDLRFTDQDSGGYYAFFVGWTYAAAPPPRMCGQPGEPAGRCGRPPPNKVTMPPPE